MSANTPQPPKYALRFLRWYCRPDRLEELEGDLEECFRERLEVGTPRQAKRLFWWDVLRCFRPYAWRKDLLLPFRNNPTVMLSNYFKTSFRNLLKNKVFTGINVFGLALSLSVCLLIITIIKDQFSIDRFNPKLDRLYLLTSDLDGAQKGDELGSSPLPMGMAALEELPQIEAVGQVVKGVKVDVRTNEKEIYLKGVFANNDLLKVLHYELKEGNAQSALNEPYSVVLTDEAARKLFGEESALGKTIGLKQLGMGNNEDDSEKYRKPCVVKGVMKPLEGRTHLDFELLLSQPTMRTIDENEFLQKTPEDWENFYTPHNYVLIKDDAHYKQVVASLGKIAERQYQEEAFADLKFDLVPMESLLPGQMGQMVNMPFFILPIEIIYFLAGLALIVLFSAAFNYTNLSIARSLSRSKEVGVRKVSGASRAQVISQFLVESVMMALLALFVAMALLSYLEEAFLSLDELISQVIKIHYDWQTFALFVLFAMLAGILAGLLPALFVSRFQPAKVLKGLMVSSTKKGLSGKQVLTLLQFVLSIVFVETAYITYKQFDHVMQADLGINGENVVYIPLKGNDYEKAAQAFSGLAFVQETSGATGILNSFSSSQTHYQQPGKSDSLLVGYLNVSPNFIGMMEIELLAGRDFKAGVDVPGNQVILNEKALTAFGFQKPEEAIGTTLLTGGKEVDVIGVAKDFYHRSIQVPIGPFVMRHAEKHYHLNLRFRNTADNASLVAELEATWKSFDTVHNFEFEFYDEQVARVHMEYIALVKIVGFAGFLSIVIACLGMLGMAIYNTNARQKEIGVRKVLGASVTQVMLLLSKGFLVMLGISVLIALPATYFLNDFWLEFYAYRIAVGPWLLLPGVALIAIAGLLSIAPQTLRAARRNPVYSLRSE